MSGPTGRRRWLRGLSVVAPVAAVVLVLETLSDTLLDEVLPFPRDALVVSGTALILGTAVAVLGLRRIDALNRELARRNDELEARATSARALHRVSVAIAALGDIDAILAAVVQQARLLLEADVAVLLLAGPDGGLRLRASNGPVVGSASGAATEAAGVDDLDRFMGPGHRAARLAAPLQRGGETLGLLAVGLGRARSFGVDDVETLASLANQATIALENARLEGRLRELAVVAERERIARELHDGVSQVLGYVNTKSQAIDELLDAGRVPEARTHLGQLATAARSVYVDVREAILGLSNPISPRDGLVSALEAHVAAVADAAKLAITVRATPAGRAAYLAPEAEIQAFRVVQEALTNVRKHASAHRVDVAIDVVGDRLVLAVADDGTGFASTVPSDRGGYGLRSMAERAASVNGSLSWSDAPSGGAIVRLSLPLAYGVLDGAGADERVTPGRETEPASAEA
jgi:signal transduction histidine kinase